MEATAKTVTQCDNCKISLKKEDDANNENIVATLENGQKKHQQYHYCNEECLRQHLNGRAKRKRAMASVDDAVTITVPSYGPRGLIEVEFDGVVPMGG